MAGTPNNSSVESGGLRRFDVRISILSGFGLVGLIIGFIILFATDFLYPDSGKSIFHEIKYSPKEIIGNSIRDSLRLKEAEIAGLSIQKKLVDERYKRIKNDTLVSLSAAIDQKITATKSAITALKGYNNSISSTSNVDTAGFVTLNRAMHFNITPATMRTWDSTFKSTPEDLPLSISYSFKDAAVPLSIEGTRTLKLERSASNIEFLSKYPSAGIWLLTILVFCSFCCFAIALSCYLANDILSSLREGNPKLAHPQDQESKQDPKQESKQKTKQGGPAWWSYYLITLIILAILALLGLTWANTFYDEEVIRDLYFMRSFDIAKYGFIGLGYIAGAFCLAGFIYTASRLAFFSNEAKNERSSNVDKGSVPDGTSPAAAQPGENETKYSKLLNIFNSYFLLSAVILTLMVLATGALYTTINSLDFVKLLSDDWGYSPARSEFVLLYGALHTVILLLIYIPARLRFTEQGVMTTKNESGTRTSSGWADIIKNPFASLRDLLIATSPLLASLVQSLFDNLFK